MKRKLSLIIVGLFIVVLVVSLNTMSYAAISISSTAVSMKTGESKNVTLNGSGVTGTVSIASSNPNVATASGGNWIENNSVNISITGKSVGTATITVSGKVADSNTGKETTYSQKVSVTVTATTTSSNNNSSAGTEKPKAEEPQKKSSNANLSNLGIRPNDFSGFKAGTTTYNVTVPKNVEEVEVYAKAQDSKSKVTGTGKKKLQEGKNTASVTVTAEDGTKKTYTINITRSATEEEDENEESEDDPEADDNNETDVVEGKGLSELKIGNLQLSPEFKTDIYEYTVKYFGNETKLEINAVTTDDDYTVDITGNDELKEGENIITILISDAEGNNIATYQITVNKALAQEVTQNQEENGMKILGIVVGIVIVIIIIFLIFRHRRNKKWGEEYSAPFSTLSEKEDDDNIYKNQLEDFDENMKTRNKKEIRENHQDKKAAKEEYLNNFNPNNNEYPEWQEETVKRRRTKGKRFK